MTQSTQVTGFRLSPQQRHLWQLQRDSRAYRSQLSLLLAGSLDQEVLEQALLKVIGQHQILRTVLRRSPGVRFPIQVVLEDLAPGWRRLDFTDRDEAARSAALDELFDAERKKPFDLERGPVVHAVLVTLAAEQHVLLLGLPTLLADSVSLRLVADGLAKAYGAGASEVVEETVQYVQFSEWQNEMLESDEAKPGHEFWQEREQPALHSLTLPLSAGTQTGGFAPDRIPIILDPQEEDRLAALGGREVVLLAAWEALLWRLTGEVEGGVGVISAGRQQEELAETPGLFARCLPLPWSLTASSSLRQVVEGVEKQLAEAHEWQDFFRPGDVGTIGVPACFHFETWRDRATSEAVFFSLQRRSSSHQRFEVCLSVLEGHGPLVLELLYDSGRIAAAAAADLARRTGEFLCAVLASPDQAIGEVELLGGEERQRLLRVWNETGVDFSAVGSVHQEFLAQAVRTPGHVAIEFGDEEMTYEELAQRSKLLAQHLVATGIGPDSVVGICLERCPQMIIAVFGILRAGGAYLPLDPLDPGERLAFMMEDSGAALVLTRLGLVGSVEEAGVAAHRILSLDSGWQKIEKSPETSLEVSVSPLNLAYVLYTSGSTGRPKGVAIPHRGLSNYLSWAKDYYRVAEGKGAPMHAPLGFDLTVTSLFAPLLVGGRVVVVPEDQGIRALGDLLTERSGFSLVKVTPAHLALMAQAFSGADLSSRANTLIVGGEALYEESLTPWRQQAPNTRLINEYGPTETVVGCSVYDASAVASVVAEGHGVVPIGRPIANTRIYLLDSRLRPVPAGVVGELCVAGDGLARGYLGRARRNAQCFVPDPFAEGVGGRRLYRTGDRSRLLPSGDLEFLGRTDHQVKVRGFRIELGEIEAVLTDHPAIHQAAVLARQDTPGEHRLVAYVVAASEATVEASSEATVEATSDSTVEAAPKVDELRRFLAERLPEYMLPAAFVSLDRLPLTGRGKLDRAALPVPGTERPALEQEFVAPRNALEETLAEILCEVLGLDQVGVNDSFFALGGDSIRSVQVVALAREQGIEMTVEQLFERLTIANLAQDAAALRAASEDPDDEASLAQLLGEMEGLSDEEIQARLREELTAAGSEEHE